MQNDNCNIFFIHSNIDKKLQYYMDAWYKNKDFYSCVSMQYCNNKYVQKRGIYELTCSTCKLSYIGQTSHYLKRKYQNLVWYDPQSACVAHILNNIHENESINNTTPLLQQVNKSPYMNSLEQFYIHLYSQNNKLVLEQCMGESSPPYQLYMILSCVKLAHDQNSSVVLLNVSYLNTVSTLVQYVSWMEILVCTS